MLTGIDRSTYYQWHNDYEDLLVHSVSVSVYRVTDVRHTSFTVPYRTHSDRRKTCRNIIKYARAEYCSIKRVDVVNALYRRAMGYTVTEVKKTVEKIIEDQQTKGRTVFYKKHIPPCYKSMMFVLKHFGTDGFEIPDVIDEEISVDTLQCTQGVDDNLLVESEIYPLQGVQGVELHRGHIRTKKLT